MIFFVKVLAASLLLFAKIAIASIDKILVLTPMPSEFIAFAEFDDQGSEVAATSKIKSFTVNGKQVVVATIGIGAVNAAVMSAFFIDEINPDLVIVSGVGGGLQKNIKIGDVVLASKVFSIHFGAYSEKGVFFQGGPPVSPVRNIQQPLIYNTAIDLIADGLKKDVHVGQVATTQNWPNNPDSVDLLVGSNVFAIAMEDAAVSQVCWMLGVPVIIVRGVSDNPVLAINYSQENVKTAAKKAAEFVIDVVQSLN